MSVVSSRTHAESYKFISKEFLSAVSQITPDYYFAENSPFLEKGKPGRFHEIWKTNLYQEKDVGKRPHLIEEVSDQLCNTLSDAYQLMLKTPIEGQENIFKFDDELNSVMRKAGAYVRPLWIDDAETQIRYRNPEWDALDSSNEQEIQEFIKSYKRAAHEVGHNIITLNVNADGLIEAATGGYNSPSFRSVNYAHKYLTKKGLDTQSYYYSLIMKHNYLFVLKEDPADIKKDVVYLFVDIPFEITSQQRLAVSTLKKHGKGAVKCKQYSKSQLQVVAESTSKSYADPETNEKKKKLYYSVVEDMEPITFPMSPRHNYSIGKYSPYKEGYEINAETMSEPSLKCFLLAMELLSGDPAECLNTGYA